MVDHPEPSIAKPSDVKLRMLDVGVCGTDREIVSFEYGDPPPGSDYLVLGHESLGEVVEVGTGVTRVKPGDLVVTTVRRPCPHQTCMACQSGRQDFCYTGDYTEHGIKGLHGFMTEFVVDEEQYMNVVPRELREVGVLTEPLTIAEKGIAQVWQVQQRLPWACPVKPGEESAYCHKAVVLGAGPVGLLGAMALTVQGFETYVYSREKPPSPGSRLCDEIGAEYICSSNHSVHELARDVGNIDLVYEATGASQLAFDMLRVLGSNAVFVFTGVPGKDKIVEIDTDLIMRRLVLDNQVVFGTVNAGKEAFEAAIRDIGIFHRKWPDALKSMITGRYPIEHAADLLTGSKGGIKSVVALSE